MNSRLLTVTVHGAGLERWSIISSAVLCSILVTYLLSHSLLLDSEFNYGCILLGNDQDIRDRHILEVVLRDNQPFLECLV